MPRHADPPLRPFAALIVLVFGVSAAGCTDYLHHRETISLHTGEAAQANVVIHTIDPWPPYAQDTHIRHRGTRIRHAAERYNAGPDENRKVNAQPIIIAPIGAPVGAPAN